MQMQPSLFGCKQCKPPTLQPGQNHTTPDLCINQHQFFTMRFALLAGLASLVSSATATALTYRLDANEKACFYTDIDQLNSKVAFYFAVRTSFNIPIR